MSDGGITVTKTTTGSLLLADIQVSVHHQVATYIPAEKALNSADLHRALNSKAIFQLTNSMPLKTPAPDVSRQALEDENRTLREALMRATQQSSATQLSVDSLKEQVQQLIATMGRLGSQPVVVQQVAGSVRAVEAATEVVGGDAPMFIPDDIVPTSADVQVRVKEETSDGSEVSEAASRLRKLRKGQGG